MTAASAHFFGKTYDEAMSLLVAARDYLGNARPDRATSTTPFEGLSVNVEAMRIVARLTQVMAWLLAQRAAQAGEISVAEAAGAKYRLTGAAACLAEPGERDERLPRRLRELLADSRQLYVRVARLEKMPRRVTSLGAAV